MNSQFILNDRVGHEMLLYLLDRGADPNFFGGIALKNSVFHGDIRTFLTLIKYGGRLTNEFIVLLNSLTKFGWYNIIKISFATMKKIIDVMLQMIEYKKMWIMETQAFNNYIQWIPEELLIDMIPLHAGDDFKWLVPHMELFIDAINSCVTDDI